MNILLWRAFQGILIGKYNIFKSGTKFLIMLREHRPVTQSKDVRIFFRKSPKKNIITNETIKNKEAKGPAKVFP